MLIANPSFSPPLPSPPLPLPFSHKKIKIKNKKNKKIIIIIIKQKKIIKNKFPSLLSTSFSPSYFLYYTPLFGTIGFLSNLTRQNHDSPLAGSRRVGASKILLNH